MKKRLVNWALCICVLPILFSCSSEQQEGNEGSGMLKVHVSASPVVFVGTNARGSEGAEENIPDVNEFSFSVFKGEALRGEWATLSEFVADDELTLRSGSDYKAKASYGDLSKEGFELPYFEGVQPFAITRGQTTDVEVTCYLANAKLSIVYTDAFKDYFSTYSSEVLTSLGNTVKYGTSETRFAYFKPGDLEVHAKVKKKEGYSQEVTLKAKEFTAEARHAYILTLDVDAGTPTLKISFSDEVANEQPVEIEISDEALSAPAPYFKANGFDETQPLSIVEGKSTENTVYAYLQAAGGIAECKLVTNSKSLLEQGWPATVDLANISTETLTQMQKLGLRIVGLGAKKDKIAMIDFSGVIPFLEYKGDNTDSEHTFVLNATDALLKVNETPLVLKVNSKDNKFAVTSVSSVLYGTTKAKAGLTLDGDPSKVSYWLKQGDGEQRVIPASIKSNGDNHELVFKFNQSQYGDIKIEARYLRRTGNIDCVMGAPVKLSLQHPGDVWTKQATLQLTGDVTGWSFQRLNGGTWNNVAYSLSGTAIPLTGLPSNTELTHRFMKIDEEGDVVGSSNQLTIHTEEEKQIPNSGFEDWYDEFIWKGSNAVGGAVDMYSFYPYKRGEQDGWWSTRNDLTTAEAGSFSYYYVVYPGTVPVGSDWSASKKIGLSTSPCKGSSSAELATIGWGEGSTCTTGFLGNKMNCKNRTAGALYIGTYANGKENYGHTFASRPTRMSFMYRFRPYNNESASASIKIEHREGDSVVELGTGIVTLSQGKTENTKATVDVTYSNLELAPTHIIVVFLSSTASSPSIQPYFVSENFNGNRYSRGIGSVLVVDDVQLNYDK